jgi:hypothetical protein
MFLLGCFKGRFPIETFGNDKRGVLEKSSCFCPSLRGGRGQCPLLTKQSSLLLKRQAFISRLLRWKAPPRWGGAFRLAMTDENLTAKWFIFNWADLKN